MGASEKVAAFLRGAFLQNLPIKFVALVLALTVFILVHSDEDAVAGVYVQISYILPEDRVLISERLDRVRVTVKGTWRRVKRFDEDSVDPVRVDLRNVKNGEHVFRPDNFRLPPGLEVQSITPANMPVRFEQRDSKTVPILGRTVGEPARGYGVAALLARRTQCQGLDCSKVTIEGAESAVNQATYVETEEVSLVGRSESFATEVALVPPGPLVTIIGTPRVRVEVTLVEELTTRELGAIPVHIRLGPGVPPSAVAESLVAPDRVNVVLRGARLAVEQVVTQQVEAYVEIQTHDLASGANRPAYVAVSGVPQGVAIEIDPRDVILNVSGKGRPSPQ
jgi:YbbR domain-containing protein